MLKAESIITPMNLHLVEVDGCTIWRCPKEWKNLYGDKDASTKFCAVCWKDVHLATSAEEVNEFALRGWCVAYQSRNDTFMGYARLPKTPPEHTEPDLLEAISRQKRGEATPADLRFIALRFLHHQVRNESCRYLRLFIDAGGQPDFPLIIAANRLGIDATDPAPFVP